MQIFMKLSVYLSYKVWIAKQQATTAVIGASQYNLACLLVVVVIGGGGGICMFVVGVVGGGICTFIVVVGGVGCGGGGGGGGGTFLLDPRNFLGNNCYPNQIMIMLNLERSCP